MQTTLRGGGDGDDPVRVPPGGMSGPATGIDFRIVAEKSLSLIVVTDPSGAIQYVNPMFCLSTGLTADEVIGRRVQDLGQLDPQIVAELWDTLRTGQPWRGELAARTQDGREFWLHSSISPMTDGAGRVTHFIAVSLDISERKRAEEALSESEERFRRLAETTTAATFIFEGARIRYANSAAAQITGYASQELMGMNFWELAHAEIERMTAEHLLRTPAGGQMPSRAEIGVITKNGETRWLDLSMGFVELERKRLVLATGFDITERRRMEEALEGLRERLERGALSTIAGHNPYNLSLRELTVLHLIAEGRSDKEIAVILRIRRHTVSKHVANLLGKMGAGSRTEAVARALREGLIQ